MYIVQMHSAAAASQGSGAGRRCISSLQVTYHQEIHKPAPQLMTRLPPSDYSSCGPVDQSLEDAYLQGTDELVPSPEEQDFYAIPAPPHPAHASTAVLQHELHGSDPSLVSQHHGPPLPCHPLPPHSPLFGLEDGLRHRINVEIENFRASIQEVMREQFASQRHPVRHLPPNCSNQQHYTVKNREQTGDACIQSLEAAAEPLAANSSQNENVQSVETSIDSGVSVDVSPTEMEATPPNIDEEKNLALIELQTLAAIISSNLQRVEYNTSAN